MESNESKLNLMKFDQYLFDTADEDVNEIQ